MRIRLALIAAFLTAAPAALADAPSCETLTHLGVRYAVCTAPAGADIRLFLNGPDGAPYGEFAAVNARLGERGERLAFAMNAGMYHADRSAVGLYIEDGEQSRRLSTRDGPGNFHMTPNGVFLVGPDGPAVMTTQAYAAAGLAPRYATQSGPMLVIAGELHPRFLPDSTARRRRNGVGVRGGETVFAISSRPVTLHDFATLFRDVLETPDALYLDGTISRLYAPALGRDDVGVPMGPIVGVVVPAEE